MQSNLSSFSWFARKRLAQERWGGIGPLLARAGRREDYRNRDEWGYPTAPNASWQDRIGALMPVSYSGIILLICILVFLLSLVARGFVYDYLVLIPHFVVERPWTILTHMFVHFSFPWKTKKNQMQEASYPPPSDDLFWSGLFTEISSSARKRAFFRLLSLIP